MKKQTGKYIKQFIWDQNISLEDREYMFGISDDDLVVYKTTTGESVLVLRKLDGDKYELLLQVGFNTDPLILGLLRQDGFTLYNFKAIEKQQLKLIGEKKEEDNRRNEEFIGVNNCSDVYILSELHSNHKLTKYRVGVYEILS